MKTVDILLATYYPNWDFFIQQLQSLNEQTYHNIRILICDDSNDKNIFQQIEQHVHRILTKKQFILFHNEQNLGSTKTFEKLTKLSGSDLLAYCDQDDIWHTNKVEVLVNHFIDDKVNMVYSDLSVIDYNNVKIAYKFSVYNPRIQLMEGIGLFDFFIRRNCVTGCAMMIDQHTAKKAIPFNSDYIHDHWLSLVASLYGKIVCVKQPLIDYRIHQNNQIGKALFKTVKSIHTYVEDKLLIEKNKHAKLKTCSLLNKKQQTIVEQEEQFLNVRINWWTNPSFKHLLKLWQYMTKDKQLVIFETIMVLLPKSIANKIFYKLQN